MSETKRKLAAIVFTDIVGFTKLTAKNQSKASSLLKKQRELFRPIIESFNGKWIKEMGDGLLLTFDTVTDAVHCCLNLQKVSKTVDGLDLRIGIHEGEILVEENDILGDDVNIASRIEPFSAPGGIAISSKVNDAIIREEEFKTKYLGEPKLKGVGQKVEVYCITSHDLPETRLSDVSAKLESKGIQWNVYSLTGAALSILGILFWINLSFIGIGVADTNEVPSVAIIPFTNKGDAKDDFYAYGISSDLIKDVSSAGMLRVAGLGDIEQIDYSKMNYDELAKELRVRYVAKGSIWKMDSMFQLAMELFDTKNSEVVWSNRWQTSWSDLSSIKLDLSNEILANLNIMVTENVEQINVAGNPEAYEYYLKGKYKYEKRTTLEDIQISRGMFEKSISLDSNQVGSMMMLARMYNSDDEPLKAEKLLQRALKISRSLNDKKSEATVYKYLGIVKSKSKQYDAAKEYYEESSKIAKELGDKVLESTLLVNVGNLNRSLENYDESIRMFKEVLDIGLKLDNKRLQLSSYQNIAGAYHSKGEQENVLEYINKALELARELEDFVSQKDALLNIGLFHYFNEDYELSIPKLEEVYQLDEQLGDKTGMLGMLNMIGMGYYYLHNTKEAIETLERALDLSKKIGDEIKIARTMLSIAGIERSEKNFTKAFKYYFSAKNIFEKENSSEFLSNTLQSLASTHYARGDLDSAKIYSNRAFEIVEQRGFNRQIIANMNQRSQINLHLGETNAAIQLANKALLLAKNRDMKVQIHKTKFLIGMFHYANGDYEIAMNEYFEDSYNWLKKNSKDDGLFDMAVYYSCLKKLNREYDASNLVSLIEETPKDKISFETNYRLYQILDDSEYLKRSYEEIMDLKSNLDDKTGDKFIAYPLQKEIITTYQSIS